MTMFRFRSAILAMAFATVLSSVQCAGTALKPIDTQPRAPQDVVVLQQVKTKLDAVRHAGNVLVLVQQEEIALHRQGLVPDGLHGDLQRAFLRTSTTVIAALQAVQSAASPDAASPLVGLVADGIRALAREVAKIPARQAALLAGWLDTAAALIEVVQ